jgi:hypothetical protein
VFVDTWAWIALALRRDQHHAARGEHRFDILARIVSREDAVELRNEFGNYEIRGYVNVTA